MCYNLCSRLRLERLYFRKLVRSTDIHHEISLVFRDRDRCLFRTAIRLVGISSNGLLTALAFWCCICCGCLVGTIGSRNSHVFMISHSGIAFFFSGLECTNSSLGLALVCSHELPWPGRCHKIHSIYILVSSPRLPSFDITGG